MDAFDADADERLCELQRDDDGYADESQRQDNTSDNENDKGC